MSHTNKNTSDNSTVDPLAGLHKMSTTAGLGSQDYVAINAAAIAAILFGVASALTIVDAWVFLVVPLMGIIFGIIALRQIGRSNGTQGGRGMALTGIILSLLFGGGVFTFQLMEARRVAPEQQAIVGLMEQLGVGVKEKNWEKAYGLFTSRFQEERAKSDMFQQRWQSIQGFYGTIKSVQWNGVKPEFQTDVKTGDLMAMAMAKVNFENEKSQALPISLMLRKEQGQWRIAEIPEIFPQPKAQGGQGPGIGSGPMPGQ